MDLILFGPAGAGKGTQAKFLVDRFGLPQVSTGEMMRAERASGSELGQRFNSFMTLGKLVPDELVIELLAQRIAKPDAAGGVIFDGFPRTIAQAEALDALLGKSGRKINRVIALDVPVEMIVDRITGRRTCGSCGHIYHVRYNPPPSTGLCVSCGSDRLVQRDDDSEIKVRERNSEYLSNTLPVLAHYEKQGVVSKIDGTGTVEEVTGRIAAVFG
ncbi:MAG: adenylate kinase [Microthrixaceae bacterium]|jgi:adenylate kinase|nr:adenylate kinase [Microthrixaceae bacterium]